MLVAGMGDQSTSDVATRIHENVLDFVGLFPESERLAYKKLVPKGRVWAGVYIDDWLCVCIFAGVPKLGSQDQILLETVTPVLDTCKLGWRRRHRKPFTKT